MNNIDRRMDSRLRQMLNHCHKEQYAPLLCATALFLIVSLLIGCSTNHDNSSLYPSQPKFSRDNALRLYTEMVTLKNNNQYIDARNLLQKTVTLWLSENPPTSSDDRKIFLAFLVFLYTNWVISML